MLEKVQAYFEGELNQKEKEAFEAEMNSNPALQAEVALYKNIKKAIRAEGMKNALAEMHFETTATLEDNDRKSDSKKPRMTPWIWIIGLGLIALLAWYLLKQQEAEVQDNPQKTPPAHLQYAQDMKSLEGLPVTLSATTGNPFFAEGMVSYRRKDFAKAVTLFEMASEQGVSSDTLHIYLANAYLATDRDEEAKELLEYISENQKSPYYEASVWFMAKYYLKHKQMDEAKAALAKVVDLQGKYAEEAARILSGLE